MCNKMKITYENNLKQVMLWGSVQRQKWNT